jgi:predicted TIM-barrel fold metal-dependent hydrolase
VPSIETLFPYLEPVWREFIDERGWDGPAGNALVYPPDMPGSVRPTWRPTDGRAPASQLELLQEHVLDPWQSDHAIVNCYYAVDWLRHPDLAAAVASAINDWLIAEWLEKDSRLRASLVVPARNPASMVKEINRVGHHTGLVQVLMPVRSDRLYGNRIWHPVYESMVKHDLVMGLHWGGVTEGAPSPSGWPSWYVEEYAAELQVYISQIVSLIGEGVFQAFPDLRVSVLEAGFAWLPIWGWRIDKDWRGLRREVPWLAVPPSTLIREHMRFSIAPMDLGPPEETAQLVEWLESEELLMFSTDYPHLHDDDLETLLAVMTEPMRRGVMSENARAWYRL